MTKYIMISFSILLANFSFGASPDNKFDLTMSHILKNYLVIQENLAKDSKADTHILAKKIYEDSKKLLISEAPKKLRPHYKNTPSQIQSASLELSNHTLSLDKVRNSFKILSRAISNWVEMAEPKGVQIFYCDMAKSSWIQKTGVIRNPYFGKQMLSCGEEIKHKGGHNHPHN